MVDDIGNLYIICEGNDYYNKIKLPLSDVWKAKNVFDIPQRDESSLSGSCQILRTYFEAITTPLLFEKCVTDRPTDGLSDTAHL